MDTLDTLAIASGIEAAQKLLSAAKRDTAYLYPVWLKLDHASNYLNKTVAALIADDSAESAGN